MRFNSITFKLLILILGAFALATFIVFAVADYLLIQSLDKNQEFVFREQIDTIFNFLARNNEQLKETGLENASIDDVKQSSLSSLRANYYAQPDRVIYPFILNTEGLVVMHPKLAASDPSLKGTQFATKMISSASGTFVESQKGQKQWYIYRHFNEWGWVIGYRVPLDIKDRETIFFRNTLLFVLIGMALLVSIVLSLIVTRFTKPIIRLSKASRKIVDGDFDQPIELKGNDEIGNLAGHFEHMRVAIRNKISEMNREIADRKRIEQVLYESEERFQTLHKASFGGIVIHEKGKIIECNQGLSKITGYPYEELIGMDGLRLIAPDSLEEVVEKMLSDAEEPYEVEGIRKDGTIYPLYLQSKLIPYKGRTVRVGEFRDVTAQKQAEKEKASLESQLRQAQKMESVGQLAGGVAHDFNNMLSAILGHTEIAMMRCSPTESIMFNLDVIQDAALRSADLVKQLLAFARKQVIAPTVLDVNDMSTALLKMLRRLIGEDIDLLWLPGSDLWKIKMDPSQVDQLLVNLCVNARDAITGVGKIIIETKNVSFDLAYCRAHREFIPGEYVMLAVSDNGCGMGKNTQERIFEPFYTTKTMGKGTGLGLATVYGVVKQNNGFINVYSEPDQGTTFRVYLQRYSGEDMVQTVEVVADLPKGKGETVLLVEDESMIREIAQIMLKDLGYGVLVAETPGEAIKLAKKHAVEIQLLITDVIMPEMNGRDLANLIHDITPKAACLFISGYTANVIAHHGVLDDDVFFLPKPFSMNDLALKVHQALGEKRH